MKSARSGIGSFSRILDYNAEYFTRGRLYMIYIQLRSSLIVSYFLIDFCLNFPSLRLISIHTLVLFMATHPLASLSSCRRHSLYMIDTYRAMLGRSQGGTAYRRF